MDAEGAVTQITHLTETPTNIEWSPDGKSIAFSMQVPAQERLAHRHADAAQGREVDGSAAHRAAAQLSLRPSGFIDDGNTHIFVLSADGGTPRQITSGDWNHGAPKWMPDGKSIVFSVSAPRTPSTRGASRTSTIDVATGEIKQLTTRKGPDGQPTPSPDGKWIAYTGYDSTSDTWVDTKLYLMNADGTGHKLLLPKRDRPPSDLTWAKDSTGIYFNVENEGSRNLYFATLSGDVQPVTTGRQVLTVTSINRMVSRSA